jgi:hypothetical protein
VSDEPQKVHPPAIRMNGETRQYPVDRRRFRRVGPGIPAVGNVHRAAQPVDAQPVDAQPVDAHPAGLGRHG